MSFENFPAAAQQQPPVPPSHDSKWRNYLTGGLIVTLLGTWGYIIWDKTKTKEIIQQKETVIANTGSERDQLRNELQDATMRYDMIKTSNANMLHSKDSVVNKRGREIAAKKEQIRQLLAKANATKEELAQAKSLINSLNGDIEDYKTQVETLKGEKIVLTQQKENITRERDKVRKDYDSTKLVLKEKDDVIDVASTLHASNFTILGINEKGNGKEKETTTAKRVDKLRISFDLDENRVSQSGVKSLYICITAPDGKQIETAGNKFTTRDGEEKSYTQMIEVNYKQGQRQTVSFDWKQDGSFITGDYKIEVYNNGFKIGEGIRSLKKGGLFS
jgi:hypothetical protein